MKINPAPPPHPGARTPPPAAKTPGRPNLPSRASFQLPPLFDVAENGAAAAPAEAPQSGYRYPDAGPGGWAADEAAYDRRQSGFGPIGMVAAALFIMVAVYLGATVLMK